MTRAKFKCVSITQYEGWGQTPPPTFHKAELQAVIGDNPENKEFFASTPSGKIEISTVRSDHFKVGKTYFIDFTETEG